MHLIRLLVTCSLVLLLSATSFPQKNWELKMQKEGINVFTKNFDNSPYKAIKVVCNIKATLSQITAVLLDIERTGEWVYATRTCKLLKLISSSELIYYSELEVPWPVSNRDFIVQMKVTQDEKTKVVTVTAENKPRYIAEFKNIVRIQQSNSKWVIVPLQKGLVSVEYILQVDPGGNIPSWLINLFATRGPYESFKGLQTQVHKPVYHGVRLPFLQEME